MKLFAVLLLALGTACLASDGVKTQAVCLSPSTFAALGLPVVPAPDRVQVLAWNLPTGTAAVAVALTIEVDGVARPVERIVRSCGATLTGFNIDVPSCSTARVTTAPVVAELFAPFRER